MISRAELIKNASSDRFKLEVLKDEAKLLGLYAPVRSEHTGKGGGPIQTEDVNETRDRLLAELSASVEEAPEGMAQELAEQEK